MAGKLPVTLGVAAGVLLLDQLTKALAVAALEHRAPVEVIGTLLRLNLVRNPGAAFSLAGNYTIFISVLAIAVTFFIMRTARTLTSVWWAVVLGGILGGALGNLTDRLFRAPAPFRGHVVDFLQLPNWPVFNVADMALVGSAILAVVLSILNVDMGSAKHPTGTARAEPTSAAEKSTDGSDVSATEDSEQGLQRSAQAAAGSAGSDETLTPDADADSSPAAGTPAEARPDA